MSMQIKATNFQLSADLKSYIIQKLRSLPKYFSNVQQVDVEIGQTRQGQRSGKIFFCEVNVSVPRRLLRYRTQENDIYTAINEAKKGIQIKLKKYKEKNK